MVFIQSIYVGWAYRTFAPVDWSSCVQTDPSCVQVEGEERGASNCVHASNQKSTSTSGCSVLQNYAEELLDFFENGDCPERITTQQRTGSAAPRVRRTFKTDRATRLEVFTTRPDTLWGATFMVLAPEHPLVDKLTLPEQRAEVEAYVASRSWRARSSAPAPSKRRPACLSARYATNPVNDEPIPIWIADYVLMGYGTGAIMAVPAHDQRDFEFAQPVRPADPPGGAAGGQKCHVRRLTEAMAGMMA